VKVAQRPCGSGVPPRWGRARSRSVEVTAAPHRGGTPLPRGLSSSGAVPSMAVSRTRAAHTRGRPAKTSTSSSLAAGTTFRTSAISRGVGGFQTRPSLKSCLDRRCEGDTKPMEPGLIAPSYRLSSGYLTLPIPEGRSGRLCRCRPCCLVPRLRPADQQAPAQPREHSPPSVACHNRPNPSLRAGRRSVSNGSWSILEV